MNQIPSSVSAQQATTQGELTVEGMTCGGCSRRVESLLTRVAGVKTASASVAARTATVRFDPTQTSLQALASTLSAAGYRAAPVAARA